MLVTSMILILVSTIIIIVQFKKAYRRNLKRDIFCNQENKPKTAFGYLKKYKFRMAVGAVIKIVGTIMDLVLPYILAYILDYVVPTKNWINVLLFGLLMLGCAMLGLLGNIFANQMAAYVAKKVTGDLRYDLFSKIQTLSSSQLDEVTIPSLVSRMTSDTYNVHQMVGMIQRIGIRAPILLIGGIIVTLTLDTVMTLVLLAILPLLVLVTYLISKAGIPLFTKSQEAVDKVVQTIRENTSGIRVIKALSKEEFEKNRFTKVNQNLMQYELKSGYIMSGLSPIISTLLNFGLVGVIVVGAYRVNHGAILSGKVLAFTTYFTIILNAMLSITRIFMVYSRAVASAARINEVMNLPEDLTTEELPLENSPFHIEFRDVSFSYNKKETNVEKIHFQLKEGESLGIIGSTGAGKSTLIQLLMRFYDVDEGEILIQGRNIKSIPKQELKKMFGVVFQNDTIFSNTIKENICFGRTFTDEEIEKATKVSQAYDFIQKQPEGLSTYLSAKGTNLSGGQKQRLLIARALVGKPEILILDDASSALDYKTDAALRKGIKEMSENMTSIIVTQRISSILNCDHILVMEDGEELGYGTHQELMKNVPIYKEIYQIQMGGESDEL